MSPRCRRSHETGRPLRRRERLNGSVRCLSVGAGTPPARSTGVKSVIRSHQLPKKMRGFEITHNSMLLTIFSASNYGGVCRNRGGVLIFDEKGPAEV